MLHNDQKLFADTVLATSEYFSISPAYIELEEIQVEGVTSNGSRFYKAVYAYPDILKQKTKTAASGELFRRRENTEVEKRKCKIIPTELYS